MGAGQSVNDASAALACAALQRRSVHHVSQLSEGNNTNEGERNGGGQQRTSGGPSQNNVHAASSTTHRNLGITGATAATNTVNAYDWSWAWRIGGNNGQNISYMLPHDLRWALPPPRQDRQWLSVSLSQIFDADFIWREFRSKEDILPSTNGFSATSNGLAPPQDGSNLALIQYTIPYCGNSCPTGNCTEACDELADSVSSLAAADRRHVIRHMAVRLSSKLTAQCATFDQFTFLLQQRIYVLHSVQSAMMRAWPRCNPNLLQLYLQERICVDDSSVAKTSGARAIVNARDTEVFVKEALAKLVTLTAVENFPLTNQRQGSGVGGHNTRSGGGSGLERLPHSAQLGIRLFFSLLECISEPDSDPQQRATFLHELAPLILDLPPLSLAAVSTPHPSTNGNASATTGKNSGRNAGSSLWRKNAPNKDSEGGLVPLGVLERLYNFLYLATMPSSDPSMMHKRNVLRIQPLDDRTDGKESEVIVQLPSPLSVEDRTVAVQVLVALACSRGCVRGLLLSIAVLLGVGLSPPPSKPNLEDGAAPVQLRKPTEKPRIRPVRESDKMSEPAKTSNGDLKIPGMVAPQRKKQIKKPRRVNRGAKMDAPERTPERNDDWDTRSRNDSHPDIERDESGSPVPTNALLVQQGNENIVEVQVDSYKKLRQQQQMQQQQRAPTPTQAKSVIVLPHKEQYEQQSKATSPKPMRLRLVQIVEQLQQLADAKPENADMQCSFNFFDEEEREVWTCGQNSYGELGHADTATRKVPTRVCCVQGKEIVHVAAGNEHSVVLTDSGDVYTAGYNDNGQCGQGSTGRVSQLTLIDKLREFGPISQVHAYNGCEHTLAVAEDGKLVSFGYNYRGQLGHGNTTSESVPKVVRTLEHKRVCLVSCSYYHSVVACESGELYTFGRNDFGQLGHGDTNDKKIPIRVEALEREAISSVACGQYHTIVSTTRGQVFTFGKNDYGQLGLESGENHRRPALVRGALEAEHCTLLRCGYYHTIALCAGGRVFAFGRNDYGQLGLGHTTQRVFGPQLISELENKGITKVAAGCYHTVAVTEMGAMYVFGRNNHGQLGTGDTTEKHIPTLVDVFVGKRISMVAAGFYHSIILTGGGDDQSDQKQESQNMLPFSAFSVLNQPKYSFPNVDNGASAQMMGPDGNLGNDTRIEDENAVDSSEVQPGTKTKQPDRRSATPHEDQSEVASNVEVECDQSRVAGASLTRFGDSVSVHPTDAAIVIMAHLDRLSAPHIPSEDQYIALDPAVGVPPSTFGHFDKIDPAGSAEGSKDLMYRGSFVKNADDYEMIWRAQKRSRDAMLKAASKKKTFCVDAETQTFGLLLSILEHFQKDDSVEWGDVENAEEKKAVAGEDSSIRVYMLVACLRLVQANIAQLLRLGKGLKLVEKFFELPHRMEERKVVDASKDGTAAHTCPNYLCPCLLAMQAESNELMSTQEINNLRSTLRQLQEMLLHIIENPIDALSSGAALVQKEAATAMMISVELFYPTQEMQLKLLAVLMCIPDAVLVAQHIQQRNSCHDVVTNEAAAKIEKMKAEMGQGDSKSSLLATGQLLQRNVTGSECTVNSTKLTSVGVEVDAWFVTPGMSPGSNKALLRPLLRRLSDDALVSRMIPWHFSQFSRRSDHPCATHLPRMRCPLTSSDETIVIGMFKILVERIASETVAMAARVISSGTDSTSETVLSSEQTEASGLAAAIYAGDDDGSCMSAYVTLLLSIQKHLMSWAGADEWNNVKASADSDNMDMAAAEEGAADNDKLGANENMQLPLSTDPGTSNTKLLKNATRNVRTIVDSFSKPPKSWDCLLQYCKLIFVNCTEALSMILNHVRTMSAGATPRTSETAMHASSSAASSLQQQNALMPVKLVETLRTTLVGGVLPSLATALNLFAERTYFAAQLLPKITELLRLSDKVARLDPSIIMADEDYLIQTTLGGQGAEQQSGKDGKSPGSAKGPSSAAVKELNSKNKAMHLPWFLELHKTLGILGGQFAGTLVTGNSDCNALSNVFTDQSSVERFSLQNYTRWLRSAILCSGLHPSILGNHHEISCEDAPTVIGSGICMSQAKSKSTGNVTQVSSYGNICSQEFKNRFLGDMMELYGAGGDFVSWMRKSMASADFCYNASLRQGRKYSMATNTETAIFHGDAMDAAEAVFAAVIFYHQSLDFEVSLLAHSVFSNSTSASTPRKRRKPPPHLLYVWRWVAKFRQWLLQCRSKILNDSADDDQKTSRDDFVSFVQSVIERLKVLMLYLPAIPNSFHRPCDPPSNAIATLSAASSRVSTAQFSKAMATRYADRPFLERYPRTKWRKLRIIVHVLCRWKRTVSHSKNLKAMLHIPFGATLSGVSSQLANEASVFSLHYCVINGVCVQISESLVANEILAFSKTVLAFFPQIVSKLYEDEDEDRRAEAIKITMNHHIDPTILMSMTVSNCRRAAFRRVGLTSFRSLLISTNLLSVRADLLRALPVAMRSDDCVGGHILTRLETVGQKRQSAVFSAFAALYADLTSMLTSAIPSSSIPVAGSHSAQVTSAFNRPWQANCAMVTSVSGGVNGFSLTQNENCERIFDIQLVLLVLDSWALQFCPADHAFVSRVGILPALQKMMWAIDENLNANALAQSNGNATQVVAVGGSIAVNPNNKRAGGSKQGSDSNSPSKQNSAANRAQANSGGSAAVKTHSVKSLRLLQAKQASWTLFRLLSTILSYGVVDDLNYRLTDAKMVDDGLQIHDKTQSLACQRHTFWNCVPIWPELSNVFEVLYDQVIWSTQAMFPTHDERQGLSEAGKALGTPGKSGSGTAIDKDKGKANSAAVGSPGPKRRSQELISSPKRFVNVEDGMVFPAETLLHNPRGNLADFSITFWLYLTQDSTGKHRVVMFRGDENEKWPLVLLKDLDRRLEITLKPSISDTSEKLVSKSAVPLKKWCHIAIVCEGAKVRLYINGSLDFLRANSSLPKMNRHPLYVGKVPDHIFSSESIKGGIEGLVAQLRFHSRALSPIHVRIVCDQGPPEAAAVLDRSCFQVCGTLLLHAQSAEGQVVLSSSKWINILIVLMLNGTQRVQQVVLQILGHVVPAIAPKKMNRILLNMKMDEYKEALNAPRKPATMNAMKSSVHSAPLETDQDAKELAVDGVDNAFVHFLLILIGLSIWKVDPDVTGTYSMTEADKCTPRIDSESSSVDATLHGTTTNSHEDTATAAGQQQQQHVAPEGELKSNENGPENSPNHYLPLCLRGHVGSGTPSASSSIEIQGDIKQRSDSLMGKEKPDNGVDAEKTFDLASELIALVRIISASPLWSQSLKNVLESCVRQLPGFMPSPVNSAVSEEARAQKDGASAGTVLLSSAALEGQQDRVRQIMELSQYSLPSIQKVESLGAICCLGGESHSLRVGGRVTLSHTDVRATLISQHDGGGLTHVVMDSSPPCVCSLSNSTNDGKNASLINPLPANGLKALKPIRMNYEELTPLPETHVCEAGWWDGVGLQKAASSVVRSQISLVLNLLSDHSLGEGSPPPSLGGVFWAQCKSKALKVLEIVQKNVAISEIVENIPDILQALMVYAIKCDKSKQFLTLDEAELKALALRKRIYQLNHDYGSLRHLNNVEGHKVDEHVPPSVVERKNDGGSGSRVDFEKLARGVPPELVEDLMVMGFPQEWCILALTENPDDLVNASTWIVDHLEMLSSLDIGGIKTGESNEGQDMDGGADAAEILNEVDSGRENYEDFDDEKDCEDDNLHENENDDDDACDFTEIGPLHMQGPNFGNETTGAGDNENDEGSDDDDVALEDVQGREECESAGDVDGSEGLEGNSDGDADEDSDFEDEFPRREKWFARAGGNAESDAFAEAYFPHDCVSAVTNPGDGESISMVQNAGHFDVYNYSASVDGMSVRDCVSERAKIKTMMSAVTRLEMSQLIAESMNVEECISILRCRMLLVCLFYTWAGNLELNMKNLGGNPQSILRLCKAICFRGAQFPIPRVSGGWMCEEKRGKYTWETSNGAARLSACDVMEDFLLHLLRNEKASAVSSTTPTTSENEVEPAQTLAYSLTVQCVEDLELASQNEGDDDESWCLLNETTLSDVDAFNEPRVCFASWGLQILMEEQCPDVFTENVARKLMQISYSNNANARFAALRALRYILSTWQNQNSLPVKTPPSPSLKALLKTDLKPGRLLNSVRRRIVTERKQGRLYFSHYLQAMIEVCNLSQCLLQGVEESLLCEVGSTALNEMEMDMIKAPPTRPHLKRNGPCTILLGWNAGMYTPESCTSEFSYTMQMCQVVDFDRQVYDGWGQDTSEKEVYKGKSTKCAVCGLSPGCRYLFRVRVENQFGVSDWSPISQFTTDAGPVFFFDKANCGPAINISSDRLSASFTSSETWSTVLGTTPFVVGRNSWQIRLDKSQTGYLFVGVATKDANLSSFLGGDEHGWGYIGDRALYHRRNKIKAYGDKFVQGDTIGVTLDLDAGTLSFSKNGVDLGVAFDNLAGELYPAVAFYNHGQSVSLTAFNCPGAGVTIEGSPSHATVNDVAEVQKVMRSFVTGESLPLAFANQCVEEFSRWNNGTTIRCTTRSGFDLQFDTSDEALAPFPFQAKQRFSTAHGTAEIVGVADHKLWFVVEGETGAWFLSKHELVQAWEAKEASGEMSSAAMPLSARANLGDLSDMYAATSSESKEETTVVLPIDEKRDKKSVACDAITKPLSDMQPKVSAFAEWPVSVESMIRLDSHITAAIGFHCHKHSLSPWNLPKLEYLEIVKKTLPKECEEACKMCAKSKSANVDTALMLRYSVLKVFNDKFSKVLEFIDLSHIVELSTRSRCLHNPPTSKMITLQKVENCSDSIVEMVCLLRTLIFFKTKTQLISRCLERTVTRAKKAEDDYDYPDDLPQVVLNRPKAAAARQRGDPEACLSYSLFGQAFDELHFLEPSALRMAYTHPMDDGQERTFKVKFEGEGVDDYGGPYRECFAQFSAELQATTGSASGVGKNALRCPLQLLLPSPNWRNGIGNEQQLFVVNPGLTSIGTASTHLYLEMFNFMGKMVGVAIRSQIAIRLDWPAVVWKNLVGQPVNEEDLEDVDMSVITLVRNIRRLKNTGDIDSLQAILSEIRWTAHLSDETEVELRPNGKSMVVSVDDCEEFCEELVKCRLHESDRYLAAIRDGLASIIPAAVLPLFSWEELKVKTCGLPGVDIDLLQENTEYDDDVSPEDEYIMRFWRVLRTFDDDDRSAFLRFVWARSRLPPTTADFHQKFKIQAAIGEAPKGDPNLALPKAHTCFFSLNLPNYTTDEAMAKQLRYAIHNCIEMDADFRLADNEMTGWDDDQGDTD